MTDSGEGGTERHRQMLTAWQRTQLSHKQRPKERKMSREWNHNSPLERGSVAPVATLLRQVCFAWPTVPRTPCPYSWAGPSPGPRTSRRRVESREPKDDGKPTLPQQIRSQERARYEGKLVQDARDAQQHDPVMSGSEILGSAK
ncbi:hypothetical protein N7447_006319 [Penicillium robsamsonii]|uniref:uncharacterized protein n=1 Tax=Penicillium robsamsonii TaxID=1792511 RepID=UPI0025483565|nr:uncharacterized protein N7447_006319 [Penicillium robsamsonii]KAJ5823979.1 hypothetical protein N7447_006319 [Penicillium robsamsonii]